VTILDIVPLDRRLVSDLARIAHNHNVFPIYLSFHTGPAAVHPVAAPFESLVAECRGYLDAMTDEEIVNAAATLPEWYRRHDLSPPLFPRDPILDRLARSIVEWAVAAEQIDFCAIVRNDTETSVLLERLPEIRECLDDDGLLVLDDRFQLHDGGIFYRDFVLHYHHLLRRGYMSNPNFDFLGAFAQYVRASAAANKFRIAIDHSRIMERRWFQNLVEMDTWRGPPFDASALDDPAAVGLTVVGRNQDSLFRLTNSLLFTDFLWTFRDGIKTFQAEEVSDVGYLFGSYNLNRYVHAERDIARGVLRHFDGAVKVYRKEDYAARVSTHLPEVPRSFAKPKLFRIDGNVAVDGWIDLVSLFEGQRDGDRVLQSCRVSEDVRTPSEGFCSMETRTRHRIDQEADRRAGKGKAGTGKRESPDRRGVLGGFCSKGLTLPVERGGVCVT
jgi:hypothetical protein